MKTRAQILSRHSYDPNTGLFLKTVVSGGRKVGSVAGRLDSKGHRQITVAGKRVLAHRVAWFLVYGYWPREVDHINGAKDDNRIANLREVTHSENMQNQRVSRSDSKTGLLGVSAHHGKWCARIRVKGTLKHLGSYSTPEAAHQAYVKAKRVLHPHGTL